MTILVERQDKLNHIIDAALQDQNLQEALKAFNMGQHEYSRAIAGLKTVKIYSGNTSNPEDKQNAKLVKN